MASSAILQDQAKQSPDHGNDIATAAQVLPLLKEREARVAQVALLLAPSKLCTSPRNRVATRIIVSPEQ
jgi:hypothetical protein